MSFLTNAHAIKYGLKLQLVWLSVQQELQGYQSGRALLLTKYDGAIALMCCWIRTHQIGLYVYWVDLAYFLFRILKYFDLIDVLIEFSEKKV